MMKDDKAKLIVGQQPVAETSEAPVAASEKKAPAENVKETKESA
jgi:hypothetical protein